MRGHHTDEHGRIQHAQSKVAKQLRGGTVSGAKGKEVVHHEMHKFKEGTLHSGSKKGPVVGSRKQAIAIALNVARKKTRGGRRRHK
jgi:hypothetical protein